MNISEFQPRILIILLWITVMFNMIFADIFSIIIEIAEGDVLDIPFDVKTMMGVAAIIVNIPILMIVLTWVLDHRYNKWTNIVASLITIVFIIGGGSSLLHYFIIGSIEIIILILIIVLCLRGKI